MQDKNNNCESTESFFQDRKSDSVSEDKERISSSRPIHQESSDSTNHSYRQRESDERENGKMTVVTAV